MDLGLKKWLEQRPEQCILEFQYLRDANWLEAVKDTTMEGEHAPGNAVYGLRELAKNEFAHLMSNALRRFVADHNGDLPADLSQLKPYFTPPFSDETLNRYSLLRSGKLVDLPKGEWLVAEIAPPMDDNEKDGLVRVIRTTDYLRIRRNRIAPVP